jgi:hypothetical protein
MMEHASNYLETLTSLLVMSEVDCCSKRGDCL